MKVKINIDTMSKIQAFVSICTKLGGKIRLTDGQDYCTSAQSLLGVISTIDWSEVYVESDVDIYQYIQEFVVIE